MKTWKHTDDQRKHQLPPGVWDDEPDKAVWVDTATGYDCMIHRGPLGNLCGYVAVPPEHPAHSVDYSKVDVSVHGGLTYSAACQTGDDESYGLCHVDPSRPRGVWWFGFDCSHHGDLTPGLNHTLAQLGHTDLATRGVYRTFDYVLRQTVQLAHQLAEMTS